MRFRIGVNLGDVIVEDDGSIYGDGVNIAARIEGLAEPGGVALSGMAYEAIDGKVQTDFSDYGEHAVKNIAKLVRVWRTGEAAPAPALPDKPSIAVLPFDNLSGDPEQEYFADGIAEDLITALSRIHWLFVIARNSTFGYKGQSPDVRQVGSDLGVRYVVEGSVRKGSNRVRVSAQLIDATTGHHVWAERYDRELADLFDLQDEITETIVAAIEPELGHLERDRAHRKSPENLDSWESYQRGLWHLYKLTREHNEEAKALFRQAIALDPEFCSGHSGLGYAHLLDAIFEFVNSSDKSIELSFDSIMAATTLDDRDAMAHYVMSRLHMLRGDQTSALAEAKQAIEINPNLALGHFGLSHALMLLGRAGDSLAEVDIAMRLSPRDPILWVFEYGKATALLLMRQHQEALEFARRAVRHPTAGVWAYITLTSVLGHLERQEEGAGALAKLFEFKPDFAPGFIHSFLPFAHDEDSRHYAEGLRKAGLEIPNEAS